MVHPPHKGRELRLTRQQVRRVDLICTERFGIPGIVLMENAARALFATAVKMLSAGERRVLIVCGGGNNGGDGYALARHLHNAGYEVTIAAHPMPDGIPPVEASGPRGASAGSRGRGEERSGVGEVVSLGAGDAPSGPLSRRERVVAAGDRVRGETEAAVNARICARMGIRIESASPQIVSEAPADLVVDALFGTGLDRPPRQDAAALIRAINQRREPVLAVDVPSGLDCDTGRPLGAPEDCVRAERTVTFVAEKVGFANAGEYTGDVIVGDIGAPPQAVEAAVAADGT